MVVLSSLGIVLQPVYLNLKFGFHTLSISDCVMPTYSTVEKDDRLDQFLWNVQLFQFFLCSYNN